MTETVLITGASSGLGKQMAIEFARRGYNLALSARRLAELESLKQELASHGVNIKCWQCDVADGVALAEMFAEAEKTFGKIDKVVANAGMGKNGIIGKQDFNEIKATIDINVTAAMATAHHAMQVFRRQGFGHMVFIASVAGFRGLPSGGAYSASKAAVRYFAESLRAETYQENIDVTVLNPGYIDTPINQGAASRPFLIDVEKGGKILVNLIEAKVKRSTVPSWPWAIVARLMAILPTALIAKMV